MTEIRLSAVSCRVNLGVTPRERAKPQTVTMDVSFWIDAAEAVAGDDIGAAVDYEGIEKKVRETAQLRPRVLAETLAAEVADAVLAFAPRIVHTRVVVHKKPVGMPKTREVFVEVFRPRRVMMGPGLVA
jgi:dihydroneopterin aldolase